MSESERSFRTASVTIDVRIAAPPERVWAALTEEASQWWPVGFYMGKTPRAFVVEARVGGRVWEDWGDGDGLLWYTVTAVRKPTFLQLAGNLGPDHGPATLSTGIRLEARGNRTRLQLAETAMGNLTPAFEDDIEKGWKHLLGECLRPWVESGRRPDVPPTLV